MRQQEMQHDIAWWIEDVGFDAVLEAVIAICQYWAMTGDQPPIEGPSELWVKREQALRFAAWEVRL